MDFISIEVSITNSTFRRSNTTAIVLRNSYLNFSGDVYFKSNIAKFGGALRLCDASLVLANRRTNVYFFNNHAEKGSTIYVQQQCMDTDPPCFLQPNVPTHTPLFDVIKDIKFIFRNNSASIAGDILYNGNIDQCLTVEFLSLECYWAQ